jgi:hypothetical protein
LNNIKVASIAHCECCCRHGRKEGRKKRRTNDLTAERDDGAAEGCWMKKRKWSFSSSIHRGVELANFLLSVTPFFFVGGK